LKRLARLAIAASCAAIGLVVLSGCSHRSTAPTTVATVSNAERIKQIQADPGINPAAKDRMIQQLQAGGK